MMTCNWQLEFLVFFLFYFILASSSLFLYVGLITLYVPSVICQDQTKGIIDLTWRRQKMNERLVLFLCTALPDKPSSVTISVASEDSLLVRFIEPLSEKVIVSKYKSKYYAYSVLLSY